MKSVVVYESMFGGTHLIADSIGSALAERGECAVLAAGAVTEADLAGADLVVVGGPTMVHSMPTERSRDAAREMAENPKPGKPELELDASADGPGLREWFDVLEKHPGPAAAAFDTRVDMKEMLTGHASHGIAKRLKKHGFTLVADPHSFLVDKEYALLPDQPAAAADWARSLVVR